MVLFDLFDSGPRWSSHSHFRLVQNCIKRSCVVIIEGYFHRFNQQLTNQSLGG